MCENNINIDDHSACNCHSSCESPCSSENHFCFQIDDTLYEKYLNISKKLACELIRIKNQLNTLRLLIILIIVIIICIKCYGGIC